MNLYLIHNTYQELSHELILYKWDFFEPFIFYRIWKDYDLTLIRFDLT